MGLPPSDVFRHPAAPIESDAGFTLAQKMVGKACGTDGIRPGTYCEPKMTTVGSQDTTGPMTRDELKDLACLGFSTDLVMQSFCHTAAYPKPVDIDTQHNLPDFIMNRGGVSLRPGDGIIHSWLNRMLLPDTVGTGGDSHTRFPMGISFPGGSGLVAFAAATGVMPLDMPESVLVRFKGKMQPGITLRDLVHAIPYYGIKEGLLTVEKKGKKNFFSGRILEIEGEGIQSLTVEQAFELSDASAERSAAGCTIKLSESSVAEYLRSNATLLSSVDSRFWICPPTRMDAHTLMEEGYYNIYGKVGARTEMPGCSLCMGNQARVLAGATVLSTSTRNFPNRLGDGANVYLTSAELATVGGILGRLPTVSEYMEYATKIDSMASDVYRYMNFDQIESFQKSAEKGKLIAAQQIVDVT
jgi:aconitase B